MPSGSCTCGAVQISFEGDPIGQVCQSCPLESFGRADRTIQGLCHCWSCRKLSGSAYTVNSIVPAANLKVTGKLKSYSRVAESGKTITNYFCDTCCDTIYGEGGFGDAKVVRMGIMDGDGLEGAKPAIEVYSERRLTWVEPVDGALSMEGMGAAKDVVAGNAA